MRDDQEVSEETAQRESLDDLVADLQRLRLSAGDVSYAEIANRIGQRREFNGISPAAARVARSSVFDAFRTGRSRINANLVAEIAVALGLDDEDAELWRSRCLAARSASRTGAATSGLVAPARARLSPAFVTVIIVACIGINLFGGSLTEKFHVPLWLDTIGTAIAAIVIGPWTGALVGLANNTLGALTGDLETFPFALISIIGALIWGYGARKWHLADTPLRFLLLNTIVAIACTIAAVPLNVLLLDGAPLHASNGLITTLTGFGEGIWSAVLSVNMLTSIVDKQISGFAAMFLIRVFERQRERGATLPG